MSDNEEWNRKRLERNAWERERREELNAKNKRDLAHFPGSLTWSKKKQILVLRHNRFM